MGNNNNNYEMNAVAVGAALDLLGMLPVETEMSSWYVVTRDALQPTVALARAAIRNPSGLPDWHIDNCQRLVSEVERLTAKYHKREI